VVALVALTTVMVMAPQAAAGKDPGLIYAEGLGKFISVLGIDLQFAVSFGMLAFATFIFDTLDVATRLGRYIFQEFTGWQKGRAARYGSTLVTLLIPLAYIVLTHIFGSSELPVWKSIWPVFGSSNQLLAALTLTGVTIWLWKTKRKAFWLTLCPTLFMLAVTLSALVFMAKEGIQKWIQFRLLDLNGLFAGFLLLLAAAILTEVVRSFWVGSIPRVEHKDVP
jgi:carbon starvation protein